MASRFKRKRLCWPVCLASWRELPRSVRHITKVNTVRACRFVLEAWMDGGSSLTTYRGIEKAQTRDQHEEDGYYPQQKAQGARSATIQQETYFRIQSKLFEIETPGIGINQESLSAACTLVKNEFRTKSNEARGACRLLSLTCKGSIAVLRLRFLRPSRCSDPENIAGVEPSADTRRRG